MAVQPRLKAAFLTLGRQEVAHLFGVGRSTVYRAIERQRVDVHANLTTTIPRD